MADWVVQYSCPAHIPGRNEKKGLRMEYSDQFEQDFLRAALAHEEPPDVWDEDEDEDEDEDDFDPDEPNDDGDYIYAGGARWCK